MRHFGIGLLCGMIQATWVFMGPPPIEVGVFLVICLGVLVWPDAKRVYQEWHDRFDD